MICLHLYKAENKLQTDIRQSRKTWELWNLLWLVEHTIDCENSDLIQAKKDHG